MKEKHLYLILLFYAFFVNAQIDKDAIIGLPIVTNNAQMNGILTPNEGSILYNSAEKKIYYFDGNNWVTTASGGTNIYEADGILTGARVLDGNNTSLTFNNLSTLQFVSSGPTSVQSIGVLQLQSSANATQISGALGITLQATSNGIQLSGDTRINNNLRLVGSFSDSSNSSGTNGQILTSTVNGTEWKDPSTAEVINKTSNYTLTANDNGKVFTFDSATDMTLTVPSALPVGFNISIYQTNTGKVTIVGAGGVNILNRLSRFRTAGRHAGAGLISTSNNNYHLTGDLKL